MTLFDFMDRHMVWVSVVYGLNWMFFILIFALWSNRKGVDLSEEKEYDILH